jgi:hypothetical protein
MEEQKIINQVKKQMSIKTIRRLRKKEPKLVEGPKRTLFIKGQKTTNTISKFQMQLVSNIFNTKVPNKKVSQRKLFPKA